MSEKKPMPGLFRDDPATPEGKYLVRRRDGTVPEWPSFVLGAADPFAEYALQMYSEAVLRCVHARPEEARRLGITAAFAVRISQLADEFREWRESHGEGDPGMGRHRKDDPATIAEMRKGMSA